MWSPAINYDMLNYLIFGGVVLVYAHIVMGVITLLVSGLALVVAFLSRRR